MRRNSSKREDTVAIIACRIYQPISNSNVWKWNSTPNTLSHRPPLCVDALNAKISSKIPSFATAVIMCTGKLPESHHIYSREKFASEGSEMWAKIKESDKMRECYHIRLQRREDFLYSAKKRMPTLRPRGRLSVTNRSYQSEESISSTESQSAANPD